MLFYTKIRVPDGRITLVFKNKRLARVIESGDHRVITLTNDIDIITYDLRDVLFQHKDAQLLLKQYKEVLSPHVVSLQLNDQQVGLIYQENRLFSIASPGSHIAYWKNYETIRVEVIDITQNTTIEEAVLDRAVRGLPSQQQPGMLEGILYCEVPDEQQGLLMVNGKFERALDRGSYGFWKYNRDIRFFLVDMRVQSIEISGQEILTKDRVSLRLNMTGLYRFTDPKKLQMGLADTNGFLYRELQLSLREAVGTKTLDELLEDKNAIRSAIEASAKVRLQEYGIELINVGVKDLILPGEMKQILNQVVEAQKSAEANSIKRREETQAIRSLHDTAKVIENNPILLRLKELEALERVTQRIDSISVYGGLEGVLTELVRLAPGR